jgi:hypothetical protein
LDETHRMMIRLFARLVYHIELLSNQHFWCWNKRMDKLTIQYLQRVMFCVTSRALQSILASKSVSIFRRRGKAK